MQTVKATYTLNIFVAYDHHDRSAFNEIWQLLDQLVPLNPNYRINQAWYDGKDLSPEGRDTVRALTEEADLVLLLMSDRSILSPFFNSSILRETLDQHTNGQSIVLPIILNTCWWEDTPFGKLEVLPRAGLPLYEGHGIKDQLLEQILNGLQEQLLVVRQRKLDLETLFDQTVADAEAIYQDWELQPGQLRKILPLYEQALQLWREGFAPDRLILEARITICQREIDFRHYAKAAQEAYKLQDYSTCFFNCKDALDLRDDAVIRKLYNKMATKLKADQLQVLRTPYETHLHTAQAHFLQLEWLAAKAEFLKSIELHQTPFTPSIATLQRKIAICEREYMIEEALRQASDYESVQDYQRVADTLLASVQQTNREALYRIDRALDRLKTLDEVQAFRNEQTNKWGFLHQSTGRILIPARYNAAYEFTEHLAGVKKLSSWGFIDIEGNEVIPFRYQYVTHFQNGIAQVIDYKDPTPYCINHRGERVEADVMELEVPLDATPKEIEAWIKKSTPPPT